MGKSFRLPNGYGSIYKLSGNRRRPYAVAKTFGWDDNGKQIKKIIGYAETKSDALTLLLEYNKNPYDIDDKKITVEDIFERLKENLHKLVEEGSMSKSNFDGLKNAYKHCKSVYKIPIMDLNYRQMQDIIDNCPCKKTVRGYIRTLFVKLFEIAKLEFEIKLDIEIAEKLKIGKFEQSTMHIPLNSTELKGLWNNKNNYSCQLALLFVYTGLRPQELRDITLQNVHLDENYMIGGCKTEAGKDRIIPIHNDIRFIIERLVHSNDTYLIENVKGKKCSYKKINEKWHEAMELIQADHYPYDARHTFATALDDYKFKNPNSKIDDYTIKLLMGHAINDVTQRVYTHRDISLLIEAVNLLNLKGDEIC